MTIKNDLFSTILRIISGSPTGYWGQVIWGSIPPAVATKAEEPHVGTSTFQGDTGNKVLLLEQAGGKRDEGYLPAPSLWGLFQPAP